MMRWCTPSRKQWLSALVAISVVLSVEIYLYTQLHDWPLWLGGIAPAAQCESRRSRDDCTHTRHRRRHTVLCGWCETEHMCLLWHVCQEHDDTQVHNQQAKVLQPRSDDTCVSQLDIQQCPREPDDEILLLALSIFAPTPVLIYFWVWLYKRDERLAKQTVYYA